MHFPFSALIDLNCKVLFPKLIREKRGRGESACCAIFQAFIGFVFQCIANYLNKWIFCTAAPALSLQARLSFCSQTITSSRSWMFMNFSGFTKIQTFCMNEVSACIAFQNSWIKVYNFCKAWRKVANDYFLMIATSFHISISNTLCTRRRRRIQIQILLFYAVIRYVRTHAYYYVRLATLKHAYSAWSLFLLSVFYIHAHQKSLHIRSSRGLFSSFSWKEKAL